MIWLNVFLLSNPILYFAVILSCLALTIYLHRRKKLAALKVFCAASFLMSSFAQHDSIIKWY